MRPDHIYSLVKNKIESIEKEIRRAFSSEVPVVAQMGSYVTESGGKRIRPVLLCLSAASCGYEGGKDVRYGVVYEFVHTATLIHDDIIDEAELRRGRPVLHHRYGTTLSILFGDLLYNKAMNLALRDDDLKIIRLISGATARMIEGEIVQSERNFSVDLSLADYMDLIQRKTADLFACCAQTGAILAEADESVEMALKEYGFNLGLAFQLIDDYFDYASDQRQIGKPVGNDLKEGKVTYPLLVLFSRTGSRAVDMVAESFRERNVSPDMLSGILDLMREHNALEATVEAAKGFADKAREIAGIIPDSPYRQALEELPRFVVERTK